MRITRHKIRHASLKHNSGLQLRASPQPNRFRYHFTHPSRWRLMWTNDTQRIPNNDTPLMFEVVWMPKLYKHVWWSLELSPHHLLESKAPRAALQAIEQRPAIRQTWALGHLSLPRTSAGMGDGNWWGDAGCIWKRLGLISLISLWWDSYIFLWDLSQLFLEGHLHWETNHSKRAVHLREESCFSSKLPVQVQLVSPHKWLNRGKLRLMRLGHLLLHDGRELQPAAFLRGCIPLHGLWIDMDEMDKRRHIMWIATSWSPHWHVLQGMPSQASQVSSPPSKRCCLSLRASSVRRNNFSSVFKSKASDYLTTPPPKKKNEKQTAHVSYHIAKYIQVRHGLRQPNQNPTGFEAGFRCCMVFHAGMQQAVWQMKYIPTSCARLPSSEQSQSNTSEITSFTGRIKRQSARSAVCSSVSTGDRIPLSRTVTTSLMKSLFKQMLATYWQHVALGKLAVRHRLQIFTKEHRLPLLLWHQTTSGSMLFWNSGCSSSRRGTRGCLASTEFQSEWCKNQ